MGESPTEGFINLMGSSTPFPPEKIQALYASREAWLDQYTAATMRLVEAQVLLPDDADRLVARAATRDLPI
ncbi:MAG: alpha/beta hydrolase domain-containing protein [Acidimicrobiia bacterium]